MIDKTVEYGLYIRNKEAQGVILIPFEGSEYEIYHLNPIKINWWSKSDKQNNIKETLMKSI